MKTINHSLVIGMTALFAVSAFAADSVVVKIASSERGHDIPETLYGIFFEDINYAADGGIYPELLANRGFDWQTKELEGWERDARGGGMARITRQYGKPVHEATAAHLRIEAFGAGDGVGVRNNGYHGIHIVKGKKYDLSFYARALDEYKGSIRAVLEKDGRVLCEYKVANSEMNIGARRESAIFPLPDWKRYTAVFTAPETADVTFSVLMDKSGVVELEQVSLFPQDTFNGRKNGLRKDLVQLLKDMKPGIVRFPGGCLTEGRDWPQWYDWKISVGDGTLESRSCIWNTWGYWQTMGLGYFEYFCLCEDIGAEPLPVMNAGLTCQFARPWDLAPLSDIDYFTDNFCDLIEFANGDPKTTKWGAIRAKMGHPKPFNMKYLGIGNENWGTEFLDRYEAIAAKIRERHPEIRLVSSSGAEPNGREFERAWNRLTTKVADVVDEHYYVRPDWLLGSNKRYDNYDRSGKKPKVYAGEYACHEHDRANNLHAAICEAAMMTGFERNSDVVEMTSYAPLFCKIGGTQWKTDLIWFDNAASFGTPSYYVQKMYATNLPTKLVPSFAEESAVRPELRGRIAFHTWNTAAEFKDVKVKDAADGRILFDGLPDPAKCAKDAGGEWSVENGVLKQKTVEKTNTLLRFGEDSWKDIALSFKFRKTAGKEGVIVKLLVDGEKGNRYAHVNLGGWGNQEHGFEANGFEFDNPSRVSGGFKTGEWYDIAITVRDGKITAAIDGKEVVSTVVRSIARGEFFQTCGYDASANELVVKLVNAADSSRPVTIDFGAELKKGAATLQLLSGGAKDVNSVAEPKKCATVTSQVAFPGGRTWQIELPAMSFSIYRIKL